MADDVLCAGVRGITDLMVMPGLVNLDFADIRTVMIEMGKAMMGTGEGDGQGRALRAAEAAISNPLLDDVSMKGAKGVLINITSGYDITMYEIDEAVNRIRDEVDPLANIIFGTTFDQNMDGKVRLSIVATGIDSESVRRFPDTDGTSSDDRSGYGYNQAVRRITTPAASGNKVAATAAQAAKGAIATAPRTAEAQAVEALRQQQAATTSPAPQQAAPVFESAFTPPVAVVVPELVEAELAAAPVMYTNADIAQERAAAGSSRGSLSFFERMTGTAGRTGRFVPEQQKPAAQPAPAAQTSAASSQTAPAKAPQDELDIPAFLRRQAN
jgi:cell division protein FtsZ